MAEGGSSSDRSLEQTPTWAVAVVCLAFVVISLLLEQSIHHVSNWLSRRNKKALYEALEKLKAELMLLGFISLLLTVGQRPISMICIPEKIAFTMLPCRKQSDTAVVGRMKVVNDQGEKHARKRVLESMSSEQEVPWKRLLAEAGGGTEHCSSKHGTYPLVSQTGMNQLHIFIFMLAVLHVFYTVLTIGLARAKMRKWKSWEKETQTLDYEFSNDPERFRLTHQTSFVRRHMSFWSRTPILKWIGCFFRQFFGSVTKTDYLTLRHGFIIAHLAPDSKFNFHKYIKRSLDDDFKSVVGISPPLWAFAVIMLLLNVYGWYSYFWLSLVPLVIVLLIGTKLQVIITELALEIQERHAVVKGTPTVQPTNELFWFNRPQLILFLIHFALFQNAFQLASFLWIWYELGLRSCFHERLDVTLVRIIIGIAVQLLCSYFTLPLYAFVTQMGSHMKKAIFDEQTANALKRWQKNAKRKAKGNGPSNHSSSRFTSRSGLSSGFQSGQTTPIHGSSQLHLLRRYKTMPGDIESPDVSGRYYHSEYEASDLEIDASPHYPPQHTPPVFITNEKEDTAAAKQQSTSKDVDTNNKEFSFAML
jgi:mlo protein